MDDILRGDSQNKIEGLIPAINHLQNETNKFNRIFDKDYAGHGGLVTFITYLYEQEVNRDKERSYKWPFWGTVIAAALALLAAGLTHRDEVMKWFPKTPLSPWEQMLERARHSKGHPRYRVHIVAPEDE